MMVVDGCQTAKIQSGYETKIGKYEFDKSTRDQDVQIVAVIPKFRVNAGLQKIKNNPSLTVIYIGADDGKVGYFEVDSYTELYSGFGYINKQMNFDQLQEGRLVSKSTKFVTSPNHEDGLYKMGVNAKVAYLPLWATTEDAFVISRSLQKQLTHMVIDSVTIDVKIDDIPLNLYGGENEYKTFPEIGEQIREDGILIGFRKQNKSSFLTDMTDERLRHAEEFHDDLYRAEAGATVIDVEIFTNHKKYQELLANTAYEQLMQYQQQYHSYWSAIVDVYEQVTRMKVGYRQPYAGQLVFAAFSGSHQDAIAKGMHYRDEQQETQWTVPYLPIDPRDVGRQYETDVIRINSQSGKGGVAYMLEEYYGYELPVDMREGIGYFMKGISDAQHRELLPNEVRDLFEKEYRNVNTPYAMEDFHFAREGGDFICTLRVVTDGERKNIVGSGNGRLDAVSNALRNNTNVQFDIMDYKEHALTKGSTSKAVSYVKIKDCRGLDQWGVGIHDDIITSSVMALFSALNRALAQRRAQEGKG